MNDIFPDEIGYWRLIEQQAHAVFQACGFGEIRTPVLEPLELFQRAVGESSDIVQKEMYTLQDRKGRLLAMRPEGTAPVVRALIQKGLDGRGEARKFYYMAPMFRYERPQKGRLRQHHQLGAEIFGTDSPYADVDLLESIWLYLESLGLKDIQLLLNSLGDEQCRPQYRQALVKFLKSKHHNLCDDCQHRLEVNPLRILDCKVAACNRAVQDAPVIEEYLCDPCTQHFAKVKDLLGEKRSQFVVNPKMVRGLDYYTRTVFEFIGSKLGAQNSICGGGRYDSLVAELGGKPTPAIGFGMGLERLVLLLNQQKSQLPQTQTVWIVYMGELLQKEAFAIARELYRQRIACRFAYDVKNLKNQLSRANKEGASHVILLGEDEMKRGEVTIKELNRGKQQQVSRQELVITLQRLLQHKEQPA